MQTLWQDVRYALRMLAKNPGFSVVAILTLALGIGANTALFSVINSVLLNPLPYQQSDQLVAIYAHTPEFSHSSIAYPNYLDWRRENHSFSQMAAFRQDDFNVTGLGNPERLRGGMVSASFFPTLGVQPKAGRLFTEQEDQTGAAPVVLIGEALWKEKFNASREALGKTMALDATLYTIIGVIPASFHYQNDNFYADSDLYIPLGQWNEPLFRDRRTGMGMDAVGRLKPGVSLAQANSDMRAVTGHLAEMYPDSNKDSGATLVSLKENVVGEVRPFLLVLLAAVGFVLLIACANVANLLLARATGRSREFAIRTAMGAGAGRVVRQLLTESALLALAGGTLGLFVATWGTQAAIKLLPEALPRAAEIGLDSRVLLFTLAASLLAGILFGLVPALKASRADIHETLKEGGRGGSGARHRTQSIFVAAEMALALVLLVGAGLMIRSLSNLWSQNPGFDPQNVVNFSLASSRPLGSNPTAIRAAFVQLRDAIRTIPGVQAVSLTFGSSPMENDSELPLWLEGEAKPTSQSQMKRALFYMAQPDYLKIMKIPLKRGRFLAESDIENSARVVVIDEQFERMYFKDQDPVGKHVNFDILNLSAEIVGVVGHVKQWGLDSDAAGPVQAQCYLPLSQVSDSVLSFFAHGTNGVLRAAATPLATTASIARAVETVNSQTVVYGTKTKTEVIANSLATKRFAMMLLGVFAGLAMLLASVGIYGVISYVVGQRTHEIGIRMALGAARGNVLGMLLGQAGKMAFLGVVIGLLASLGLARLMATMLFGVSTYDPLTFLTVTALLVVVALAACYLPARRATKIDPLVALRYE